MDSTALMNMLYYSINNYPEQTNAQLARTRVKTAVFILSFTGKGSGDKTELLNYEKLIEN